MSEKEFWTKYSRAEYLHSTKNIVAAAAEAAEDEELAVFLKQDDMLAFEARKKVCVLDDYCFHCFLTTSILKGLPSSVLVSLFPFSFPLREVDGEVFPEVFTEVVFFSDQKGGSNSGHGSR